MGGLWCLCGFFFLFIPGSRFTLTVSTISALISKHYWNCNVVVSMKCQIAIHKRHFWGFFGLFLTSGSSSLQMSETVEPEALVAMLGMVEYPLTFDRCGGYYNSLSSW